MGGHKCSINTFCFLPSISLAFLAPSSTTDSSSFSINIFLDLKCRHRQETDRARLWEDLGRWCVCVCARGFFSLSFWISSECRMDWYERASETQGDVGKERKQSTMSDGRVPPPLAAACKCIRWLHYTCTHLQLPLSSQTQPGWEMMAWCWPSSCTSAMATKRNNNSDEATGIDLISCIFRKYHAARSDRSLIVCVCVCALRSVLWSSCLSYCCCIALFHFVKRARSSLHAIEHSFLLHFPTVLFLCLVYVTATWVCVLHIFRYIHFSWLEKCLEKFFCKANQQLTRPAWRATHWTEHGAI